MNGQMTHPVPPLPKEDTTKVPHTRLERMFGYLPEEVQLEREREGKVQCYPVNGGVFWIRKEIDLAGGCHNYTLRMMGDYPNPIGIELARFNSAVVAHYGERLVHMMVDKLNGRLGT